MATFDIIPDNDIHAHDVRDTLNANGGMVDNDMLTFFSAKANIAMWSKYKPVVDERLFIPLAEWKESAFRGSDGKCGLAILSMSASMQHFHQYLDNGTAIWTYTPPNGDITQPRRMGDFRGYNPKAMNPVGEIASSGYSENGDVDVLGDVDFSIEISVGMENNLELGDIRIGGIDGIPLTDFYLGIYAWKSDSEWYYRTADTPVGETYNLNMTIPLTTGKWNVTPFFCSVAQDGITGLEGIYLGANVKTKTFTIISTNDRIVFTVHGIWNTDKTVVQDIYVFVKNQSSDDITLDRIGIELRGFYGTEDNNVGSPATVYYKGSATKTLSVPANTEIYTEIGDFGNIRLGDVRDEYSYYLNAFGYAGDTLYSHTYGIEEQQPEE